MSRMSRIAGLALLLAASAACAQPFRGESVAIAADRKGTMTIFSVATTGALTPLATTPTARGAHCVATDGKDAYVCDPGGGRILVVRDSFPAARPQ